MALRGAIRATLAKTVASRYYRGMESLKSWIGEERGAVKRAAEAFGVPPPLLSMWISDDNPRRIPADRCPTIEFKTSGRVTVREMRPDLSWYRRPDPQWPHPEGRPCLDFVGEGAPAVTGAQEAA